MMTMPLFQWVKQLIQPATLVQAEEFSPSGLAKATAQMQENRQQQQIVSQQDVYHHNRPVLLLKSGQVVKPRTLAALHNQGVPVMKYCALQNSDGTHTPLDHSTLRRMLAQHEHTEQFTHQAMNRMMDLQSRRSHTPVGDSPQEPQAWQRHFKVLVVSDAVALQEKVRQILEKADILPQQIRPVMHLEAFMYSYEKYRPTCILFDEATYRRFSQQGFDLIQFIQATGGGNVESMVCIANQTYLAPILQVEDIDYRIIPQPVHRQLLMAALDATLASIKRTYSNTLGQTAPLVPTVQHQAVAPTTLEPVKPLYLGITQAPTA